MVIQHINRHHTWLWCLVLPLLARLMTIFMITEKIKIVISIVTNTMAAAEKWKEEKYNDWIFRWFVIYVIFIIWNLHENRFLPSEECIVVGKIRYTVVERPNKTTQGMVYRINLKQRLGESWTSDRIVRVLDDSRHTNAWEELVAPSNGSDSEGSIFSFEQWLRFLG